MQFDTVVNYMGYNDIEETTMEFNRAGWKEENLQDQAGVISYSMCIKQGYDDFNDLQFDERFVVNLESIRSLLVKTSLDTAGSIVIKK